MSRKVTAIIVAAGRGSRMGGEINKVLMPLGTKSVIAHTVSVICECDEIDDIIIVTRECDISDCLLQTKDCKKPIRIIKGGDTRQESVYLGLLEAKDADIALIHDGARALILPEIIKNVLNDAYSYGAATAAVPCKDTLKQADEDGFTKATLDRESTYLIQTPQIFDKEQILKAHKLAILEGFSATDDCSLYEKYISKVKITLSSYDNIKLTTPDDMIIAENILKKRKI